MTRLVLSEVFPPQAGGSGRWLWEIYRRILTDRTRLIVGTNTDNSASDFDRDSGLRIQRRSLSPPTWGLLDPATLVHHGRLLGHLRRLARDEVIEQVHCGKCLSEGLTAWMFRRLTGIPYLCYAHGEEFALARTTSRELRFLTRRVLQDARVVIANSWNTHSELVEHWGLPAESIAVIHPGVDLERFQPAPPDPELRDALGWRDRTVLLTVGRLQPRKGQDQVIRALSRIREAVPDVLYALVGDGDDRQHLEALAAQHGVTEQVRFHGLVDDGLLPTLFQQADLFVLANRRDGHDFEGFGMVLLEAQACGRPILAGRSGGTAETLDDGRTGRLVDANEPGPIAEAIVDLLGDRQRLDRMGLDARHWVETRFCWSRQAAQAADLFDSLSPQTTRRVAPKRPSGSDERLQTTPS